MAPAPVWTPQPRGPSRSRANDGSTLTTERAATTACEARLDWPKKNEPTASPFASVSDDDPSGRFGARLSGRKS